MYKVLGAPGVPRDLRNVNILGSPGKTGILNRDQRGLRYYDPSDPRDPRNVTVPGLPGIPRDPRDFRDVNIPGNPRYHRP